MQILQKRQCSLRVRVDFKEGQIPGSVNIEYFQVITSIRGKKVSDGSDSVLAASWRRPDSVLTGSRSDGVPSLRLGLASATGSAARLKARPRTRRGRGRACHAAAAACHAADAACHAAAAACHHVWWKEAPWG